MRKANRLNPETSASNLSSTIKYTSIMLAGIAATLIMNTASAHQYTCQQGAVTRVITVEHEPNQPLPCSVRYEKPDEGNTVTFPWHANTTSGFCEEKADYLAEKLSSNGWLCEKKKSHE
jgi:hypothetical protein